jgi:uncharacterized protein YqiB (DUF1249 family)
VVKSVISWKRPPLDLSARMAVCDANYLRLLKLMPEFRDGLQRTILLPAVREHELGSHRLDVQVLEHFRYTTTLRLSLVVEESTPYWFQEPRLVVRLYHDAGTAEVVSYQDHVGFKAIYAEDDAPRFNWDEKNQINLFLADWLKLCLEGGVAALALPACLNAPHGDDAPAAETEARD